MTAFISQDVVVNLSIKDLKIKDQHKSSEMLAYIGLDDKIID